MRPQQLLCWRSDINIQRSILAFLLHILGYNTILIQYVFNEFSQKIWPLGKLLPTWGELEIGVFRRNFLAFQLMGEIKSYFIVIFIDAFGLYHNMDGFLTGVYIIPSGLSGTKRQKSWNCYMLTLGPHGLKFNNVACGFHTSINALDSGCTLMINKVKTLVWAPVMAYLGDMKQQQDSADFLRPWTNLSCRFYDANTNCKRNPDQDTISYGWYHYQVFALRKAAARIFTLNQQKKFFSKHSLAYEMSTFADISPALDTVLGYPPDLAHNKYY